MTASEIQAAESRRSRRLLREERKERGKWGWLIADAREAIEQHPDWTIEMSGDHRPRPVPPRPPSLIERIRAGLDAPRGTVDLKALLREALEELGYHEAWTP